MPIERLTISTSTGLVRMVTDDIVYVEADGNYSEIHLYNGKKYLMTFQLHYIKEALNRLKYNPFVRVGRSYIVNVNYISIIDLKEQKIYFSGGRLQCFYDIEVSKEAIKELKSNLEEENLAPWQKGGNE